MSSDYRLITTWVEFHDALREAFAEIAQQGCREIWMCDTDFADWPIDEPGMIELLTSWALPHRKLTLIARDFDEFPRRHPRWTEWRRTWSHVVDCRVLDEADALQPPVVLLAPGVITLRLVDLIHPRGSLSREAGDMVRNRELIDAVSQRSIEGFPATILGL
jgi:hypothetical protein